MNLTPRRFLFDAENNERDGPVRVTAMAERGGHRPQTAMTRAGSTV